jgi:hypothetical protein
MKKDDQRIFGVAGRIALWEIFIKAIAVWPCGDGASSLNLGIQLQDGK